MKRFEVTLETLEITCNRLWNAAKDIMAKFCRYNTGSWQISAACAVLLDLLATLRSGFFHSKLISR